MLAIRELNHDHALDRKELETITGGVNYSLVRSYYSSTTKKSISYTWETLYRLKKWVAA